jgi:anaerobic selenocysteine-containing dehydrogenase
VLAGTDWLERSDINLMGNGFQAIPHVRFSEAMTPPAAQRRNEWWILERLAQAIGLPSRLDQHPDETEGDAIVDSLLAQRGTSREALLRQAEPVMLIPDEPRESLFDRCLVHADGKIDCYPRAFAESGLFDRCAEIFDELDKEEPGVLKLISLRTPYMQNSWFANVDRFATGRNALNPLNMCESDAAGRGLANGDRVRISTPFGSIDSLIFVNDDLREGVVAMTHGFGHSHAYGLSVASKGYGVNCNSIMPIGAATYEPVSYMSWLTGVPVSVEKIDQAPDARH